MLSILMFLVTYKNHHIIEWFFTNVLVVLMV